MNSAILFGAGVGLGTGLMFLLDPARGKRRRALVRDKWNLALRKTGECMEVTARDVSNRTRGLVADIQGRLSSEQPEDSVLVDRVRSKIGRVVSHPSVIEVTAQNGKVTLSGPILASEVGNALSCVGWVRGVNDVVNNLEVHEAAENHPALQGGRERQASQWFHENWSPTARLLAGAAGASLAVYGGTRRNALGAGLGAAGLLLMTRGITNSDFSHLIQSAKQMGGGSERAALTQ